MIFRKKKKQEFKKVENKDEVIEENPMKELVEKTSDEEKEVFEIVKELPKQEIRKAKADDGTIITYITIEEALTKIMNEED